MDEAVVQKIKKLLARTVGAGCTPEEAATCAAKAAQLMADNQISLAAIAGVDNEKENKIIDFVLAKCGERNRSHWRLLIANGVCKTFGIFLYASGGEIRGIGRRADVETSRMLYEFLEGQVNYYADMAFEEYQWENLGAYTEHGKRWKTSFRIGCAQVIESRMRQEVANRNVRNQQKAIEDPSMKTALVVLNKAQMAIREEVSKRGFVRGGGFSTKVSNDGYSRGVAAGKNVNIAGTKAKGYLGS